ncbi:MAG: hypothetical protein RLZZ453_961 [Chlamydiota bacterium]|jgi:uncharacterized protein (DUF952 family)
MFKWFFSLLIAFFSMNYVYGEESNKTISSVADIGYLYKIVSVEDWEESQGKEAVKLSFKDQDFIHLAKENQLPYVIAKFWSDRPYVVLRLDPQRLPGKLVSEGSEGSSIRWYHLYDGSVPMHAVVEVIPK